MKIAIVYGQSHKGSTFTWVEKLIERFPEANVQRFFMPRQAPAYCVGCMRCFSDGEAACPHAEVVQPVALRAGGGGPDRTGLALLRDGHVRRDEIDAGSPGLSVASAPAPSRDVFKDRLGRLHPRPARARAARPRR